LIVAPLALRYTPADSVLTGQTRTMLSRIRTLYLILNLKTLGIVMLALVSTYVCRRLQLAADFPMAVVMTAVVFPIVFSISAAYTRREKALAEYANMKAHAQAIFLATRDWLDDSGPAVQDEIRALLTRVFSSSRDLLMAPQSEMKKLEDRVYRDFSELSRFVRNSLRAQGLAVGEISRVNQYVSKMLISFETVKHIYQYRTPISLRTFSDFFLILLPLLYGPYFAHLGQDYLYGLAYVPPVLFSLVLVTLDNIQDHLENPFDQVGEDDIDLSVEDFVTRLGA
jgi:hypothetical protein